MHTSLTTLGLCFRYACSCGLFVVSTRVGGVPEVLKRHMVQLAEPSKHTTPVLFVQQSHACSHLSVSRFRCQCPGASLVQRRAACTGG